ncbi:unnamed protein product [Meganyctiphanes norvegica]|uniref:BZIP domain-containing protein n=1 Tax=Meganyctiphanes norvegica TaxID=48144 RepID=A0AAV2R7V2_MEGNR
MAASSPNTIGSQININEVEGGKHLASGEMWAYSDGNISRNLQGNKDTATGHQTLQQNGGSSLAGNKFPSKDPGISICKVNTNEGNILMKGYDGEMILLIPVENNHESVIGSMGVKNPVVIYNSKQFYQVPIGPTTEYTNDNVQSNYNVTNTVDKSYNSDQNDIKNDEITVDRSIGLQEPVFTMNDSSMTNVNGIKKSMILNGIGVSPAIHCRSDGDNNLNDISESESTNIAIPKFLVTQKGDMSFLEKDLSSVNMDTNGPEMNKGEVAENLSSFSDENIITNLQLMEEAATGNTTMEEAATGNTICQEKGGNSFEGNYLQSDDPGTSFCKESTIDGNISTENKDRKEYILIYDGMQYFEVPIVEKNLTHTPPEYARDNSINVEDNIIAKNDLGVAFPFTNNCNSDQNGVNSFEMAVESYNGLDPMITMDDDNLEILNDVQKSIPFKSLIGVSPSTNDNTDEDNNSSNKDSQIESKSDNTLTPLSTQKRKKTPLYAQPEPKDEVLRARWKRARTTEKNRREKFEKTNTLEIELDECKKKLSKSEELRKKSEEKNEALTKENMEKSQYIESLLKYIHGQSNVNQFNL